MPEPTVLPPAAEYQTLRDEIRAEHTLIANRLAWYVTSQSFLVTAFTISRGAGFHWHPWFSTLLLPSIGFLSSLLVLPSIVGACLTIRLWHRKQQLFFDREPGYRDAFELHRASWVESRGLLFPQVIPQLFAIFWLVIHVAGYSL